MKVKVLKRFYDKSNNLILRRVGEEFDAESDRANQLEKLGYAKIVCKSKPKTTENTN